MTDSEYALVLGDKNYSSWSLRPWCLMRAFSIPFREINIDITSPGARKRILAHSPSGLVPALKTGDLLIWDTLAIVEFLAEHHAPLPIWPEDADHRALARCVAAEMHSGFANLRTDMPMDFIHTKPAGTISESVARDIRRIVDLWRFCRARAGDAGPYLFGAFCAADAMYAPVASRLRTYSVDLAAHGDDGTAATYCKTVLSGPVMAEWANGADKQIAERGRV